MLHMMTEKNSLSLHLKQLNSLGSIIRETVTERLSLLPVLQLCSRTKFLFTDACCSENRVSNGRQWVHNLCRRMNQKMKLVKGKIYPGNFFHSDNAWMLRNIFVWVLIFVLVFIQFGSILLVCSVLVCKIFLVLVLMCEKVIIFVLVHKNDTALVLSYV